MPSRYHPIEDGLWDDPKLEGCSFEAHGFFAFLCSNHRQRPSGIYRATDGQLAADTGLSIRKVSAYLSDLHTRGPIVRDGAWIFTKKYFKRQKKGPWLLVGAETDVKACVSRLVVEAFAECYPLYKHWVPTESELSTPNLSAQSRAEQSSYRAEQSSNTSPRGMLPSEAPWGCPEALALKYNRETPDECRSVVRLTDARKRKAREYLSQFPDEAFWSGVFQQFHRSRFLRGLVEASNGHKSFRADLDWLLSRGKDGSENAVKVSEGRYLD